MNKQEFLGALRERLSIFPDNEIEGYISYYSEMIDDHVEDGYTEQKVIETLGSVDGVMAVILEDVAITHLLKSKVTPKKKMKKWKKMLLIFGFPVWIPLAVTAFALVLSLYIVLWTLILCLYVIDLALPIGALFGIIGTVIKLTQQDLLAAGIYLGGSLILAGLTLALFRLTIPATKGMAKLSKKIMLGIKFLIIGNRKEEVL